MSRGKARPPVLRRVAVLLAPTAAALALALLAMQLHRPTRVVLVLTLDRFAATLAPDPSRQDWTDLINQGQVRSVRIDRLGSLHLTPSSLEVRDDGAWRVLATRGDLVLEPVPGAEGLAPAVTLHAADAARPFSIKAVRAPAGALVAMDLAAGPDAKAVWLTLDLAPNPDAAPAADPPQVHLVFPEPFVLDADYLRPTAGLADPSSVGLAADGLSLRASTDGFVAVQGTAQGLVVQLEPVGSADPLLVDRQVPVSAVDFTRQGPGGERQGSLIAPGTLRYPDFPNKAPVALSAADLVSLGPIEKARILSLGLASEGGRTGLRLTLDAIAAGLRIGTPEQPQDARLTWFDWLWESPGPRLLFAIALWFFPTTLAGYKLWQALRSRSGVA